MVCVLKNGFRAKINIFYCLKDVTAVKTIDEEICREENYVN